MKNIYANKFYKITVLVIADLLCAALAIYLSAFVRFFIEYSAFPAGYLDKIQKLLCYWLPVNFFVFYIFRMYKKLWEYASVRDAVRIVVAVFFSSILLIGIGFALNIDLPRSTYPLTLVFQTILVMGTRFFYRILRVLPSLTAQNSSEDTNVMIIGAGNAGNTIIREIVENEHFANFKVVCAIDDDPIKLHKFIGSTKIVGGREKIYWAIEKYHVDEIIFAIPSADEKTRKEFFEICKDTKCIINTLPNIYQLVNSKVSLSMLKRVEISDLLERPQIDLDIGGIRSFVCGKIVLVTGAGGSIGSELCRQLAKFSPSKLIILDIYENSMFNIQNELIEKYPNLDLVTIVASVRDAVRLDSLFSTYKPDIVYHAAAHKHVPLMEGNPNEAVKNNVFGTLNIVHAADKYGTSRFVLISTDKAVNPTSVMGATKRICEMIVQNYGRHSRTKYVAVRFGNVLGSNGSVIPTFSHQIKCGGPVTVTHPDITRYFMTIQEAVSLVLQAGTFAKGGEIFILDMGEPVKILSMAENMIRLSGRVPYKDIDIKIIGLRPGEKIIEELMMSDEEIYETPNKKIFVGKPIEIEESKFLRQLEQLRYAMEDEECDIRSVIKQIVPTFNYAIGKVEDISHYKMPSCKEAECKLKSEERPMLIGLGH